MSRVYVRAVLMVPWSQNRMACKMSLGSVVFHRGSLVSECVKVDLEDSWLLRAHTFDDH